MDHRQAQTNHTGGQANPIPSARWIFQPLRARNHNEYNPQTFTSFAPALLQPTRTAPEGERPKHHNKPKRFGSLTQGRKESKLWEGWAYITALLAKYSMQLFLQRGVVRVVVRPAHHRYGAQRPALCVARERTSGRECHGLVELETKKQHRSKRTNEQALGASITTHKSFHCQSE